jgi:hypothetical protein
MYNIVAARSRGRSLVEHISPNALSVQNTHDSIDLNIIIHPTEHPARALHMHRIINVSV